MRAPIALRLQGGFRPSRNTELHPKLRSLKIFTPCVRIVLALRSRLDGMRKVEDSISELRSIIVELENHEGDVDLNPTQIFAITEENEEPEDVVDDP